MADALHDTKKRRDAEGFGGAGSNTSEVLMTLLPMDTTAATSSPFGMFWRA